MATRWAIEKQLSFLPKNTCGDLEPKVGSISAMFKENYTKTEQMVRLHGTDRRLLAEKTLMRTIRGNMLLSLIQSAISPKML